MGEMAEEEVTITYETLYDLLKREKERSELQKLDSTFFLNLLRYLKDKQTIITKQQTDLFSIEEKEKTTKQLINIKKIVTELYNKREKKIISMAIDKARNQMAIVDSSALLKEEKELFDTLLGLLGTHRNSVLSNVLDLKEPQSGDFSLGKKEVVAPEEKKPVARETKLVRFLHSVPKFVGRELEEYGPFEEEDIASLPVDISNVLLNKGRVEEINEN